MTGTPVFKYHNDLLAFLCAVDPTLLVKVLPEMLSYVKEGAALRSREFAVRLVSDHQGASELQLVTMRDHSDLGYTERVAIKTHEDVTTLLYTLHRVLRILYVLEPPSLLGALPLTLKQWTDQVMKKDLFILAMNPSTVYPEYYLTWDPPCNGCIDGYSPPILTGWDDRNSPVLPTRELQVESGRGWIPVPPALMFPSLQKYVGSTLSSIIANPSIRVNDWAQWATYVVAVQTQQQLCAVRTNQWMYNGDNED